MNDTLSTAEYAELIGVSRRTVQRWVADGLIFGVTIGRSIQIAYDEQPPNFRQIAGIDSSDVLAPVAVTNPSQAGFPVDTLERTFEPEDSDFFIEDEEGGEEDGCEPEEAFERSKLRKAYATKEEAENYAGDIPVPTVVFKRCSDGFFQVAIEY